MNIFDLKGPEFLTLYATLIGVSALLAFLYGTSKRNNGISDSALPDLSPFETAYLRGGEQAITNALLAHLVQTKTIEAHGQDVIIKPTKQDDPILQELAPFLGSKTVSASDMRIMALKWTNSIKSSTKNIAKKLEHLGLILSKEQASKIYGTCGLIALSPIIIGIPKVLIGLERAKPVAFLCLLIFINLVVALLFWSVRTLLTSRGDCTLRLLTEKNATLKTNASRNPDALTATQVALASALFGPAIFSAGMLGDFHKRIVPPSAGGSGCGSGSSCGGGGCGGGCGGCGG